MFTGIVGLLTIVMFLCGIVVLVVLFPPLLCIGPLIFFVVIFIGPIIYR